MREGRAVAVALQHKLIHFSYMSVLSDIRLANIHIPTLQGTNYDEQGKTYHEMSLGRPVVHVRSYARFGQFHLLSELL